MRELAWWQRQREWVKIVILLGVLAVVVLACGSPGCVAEPVAARGYAVPHYDPAGADPILLVEPDKETVAPGESVTFRVTISVPENETAPVLGLVVSFAAGEGLTLTQMGLRSNTVTITVQGTGQEISNYAEVTFDAGGHTRLRIGDIPPGEERIALFVCEAQ